MEKSIYYKREALGLEECYRFAVKPFSLKDYFNNVYFLDHAFELNETMSSVVQSARFMLVGYCIRTAGGDPYDFEVPLALSDNAEELVVTAEVDCLSPLDKSCIVNSLVNKLHSL